jgi:hypothetical protein
MSFCDKSQMRKTKRKTGCNDEDNGDDDESDDGYSE